MDNARKKDLVREYKEAKKPAGIFAVRCVSANAVWVGASPDLTKTQNRIWFSLRTGAHVNKAMQAAWNAHGAESFSFEVLEEIGDDNPEMVTLLLKERDALWREQLSAAKAAV